MIIWRRIRPYIRNVYRIIATFYGFLYDFKRFVLYSGWRENMNDINQRNYKSVMVYHGLEKSLSYQNRNPKSGWKNVYEVLNLLNIANKSKKIGYHDRVSKQVIEKFIELPENQNYKNISKIKKELKKFKFSSNEKHGVLDYSINEYKKGILEDPETFFFTRYSLREFKNEIVDDETILRAIKLSTKTPSVCNRQGWHIYHTSDKVVKDSILKYQTGNKPFGENIPNLIVVTVDLKAFFAAEEHYQHWIDGGLLSMSIIYAFHSLGVATCALNWSQTPQYDKLLRKAVNIQSNHTVIMILAVGYPDKDNKVCVSPRRPVDEVFSTLECK